MQNLLLRWLTISWLATLGGCASFNGPLVESDYSYSGNFSRYRTYDFVHNGGLTADSSRMGSLLRDAIQTRLSQQGYHRADGAPDLLVNFQVFEGNVRLQSYVQPELARWVRNGTVDDDETPESQRQGYHPLRRTLTNGTLLVTLIDGRNQRAVWNGYASGVQVPNDAHAEVVLARSVRSIFDNYRVFTEGFLRNARDGQGEQ